MDSSQSQSKIDSSHTALVKSQASEPIALAVTGAFTNYGTSTKIWGKQSLNASEFRQYGRWQI